MERGYWKYWGKSVSVLPPKLEHYPGWHLLPYHCLDVAAVAAGWWDASPPLRRAFSLCCGVEEEQAKAWALFFIALHDYGKLDVRFQYKSEATFKAICPMFNPAWVTPGLLDSKHYFHGPAGLYWFRADFQQAMDWNETGHPEHWEQVWLPWLAAVTGHHGVIPDNTDPGHKLGKKQAEEPVHKHDRQARIQWVETLERLFLHPAGLSLQQDPPACPPLLAGFCAVCDWLGSDASPGGFAFVGEPCEEAGLAAYFQQAQAVAAQRLAESGLSSRSLPFQNVAALIPADENGVKPQPRQVQTLVDGLPLQRGLSIIEAPTGSGKTEAALAYAWRLLDAGLADSIVFALPTQATANAMLDRLEKIAVLLFGEHPNLVLAHGKARFNEDFWNLKEAANKSSAQEGEEARAQCAAWLSASRKRAFLGQIGVCTVDQVLASVLPLKHNFVRQFGVGKSVLIVDEVHAYDCYMYGLLDEVLQNQRASGGSAILLSATLPSAQRQMLLSAWKAQGEAKSDAPYPLVSHCTEPGGITPFELPEHERPKPREVALKILPRSKCLPAETDELCERMLAAAERGAQVVFICNLVDDAQGLAERLTQTGRVPVELFHARYRFRDRQAKENRVMDYFGKDGKRRGQGRILVATQVVEQSLDLDFDWLLTQLCPVDLLFQRLGRLHRHPRLRPEGFEDALCTVLVPDDGNYGLHGLIYGNTRVLWRTAQMLEQAGGRLVFPESYRAWIEKVYEEERWPDEPEAVNASYEKFWNEAEAARMTARRIVNEKVGELSDTDAHVATLTRDGEMNLNLLPVLAGPRLLDGRLIKDLGDDEKDEALNLDTVSVPSSWRGWLKGQPEKDGLIFLDMVAVGEGWEAALERCHFSYSRKFGLRLHRKA